MIARKQLIHIVKIAGLASALFFLNSARGKCEIIPADRQVTWQGNVGVPGGIPVRTTVCATLSPSGGDDTAAIQNALNSCPQNQVVKLSNGTFNVSNTIDWQGVNNGVVLRGNGPTNTTITFSSGGMLMRGMPSESALSTDVDLSADAVKGQNTINLSSVPSWITVGNYYIIDQLDDPSFVASGGTEGGRSYREIMGNGARGLGQIVKVTAKTSTQVTVEIPLYYGFQVSQKAQLAEAGYDPTVRGPKYQCGIEDLRLTASYSGSDAHMINMQECDSCWIKNVESYNSAGGSHVMIMFSYRCEIRDSYFHDCHMTDGGQAYGVSLYHVTSACLVENNIFEQLHGATVACFGASGNVFGYNYELNGLASSGQFVAMSTHGVHAYMNLWEGNYVEDKALGDWSHGSSSHNTLFRNRIVGYKSGATQDQTPVSLEMYNRKWNVVGNILGSDGFHDTYSFCASGACSASTCEDVSKGIFKLGYKVNWGCDDSSYDTLSVNDALIDGNYDYVTHSQKWDPAVGDTNLRSSYYLPGKPSWFGPLAWPPFDPANPAKAVPTSIPAGYRYANGSAPAPSSAPAAPKNLRILS